jgi:RNA polymerase sigma-70 factor (ECF subfamily)
VCVVSDAPLPPTFALSDEDRRLVAACLADEPGAWESLVDRFGRLIAHVVSRTARQRGIALGAADREDLVADVLVELLRNDAACLRSFAGRASLPTYLTVISRRVAARRMHDAVPAGDRRPHARAAAPARRPDDEARRADREHVEALLEGLEADEARLVRLHHIEQRSYGEISHLTGMPLGSIGPALSRARAKMRRLDADADAAEQPSGPRAEPTADR